MPSQSRHFFLPIFFSEMRSGLTHFFGSVTGRFSQKPPRSVKN